MEQNKTNTDPYVYINIIVFCAILFAGGIFSILLPKQEISKNEKRRLTPIPSFSYAKLFDGIYTDSLDTYYADNFPLRDKFIMFTSTMKDHFGIKDEEVEIFNLDKAPDMTPGNLKKNNFSGPDTSDVELDSSATTNEYIKAVFVCNKKAFQLFGGTKRAAATFAYNVSQYKKAVGNSTKVYCLVIPTLVDFYLPKKYRYKSVNEKQNIDYIYSKLDSNVIPVRAYEEIEPHKKEYLYFNTDHHWTGLGAYYAYRGFCASSGFRPYELSDFKQKTIRNFLGSMYYLTLSEDLKENIDSVVYYKFPVKTYTTIYEKESSIKGSAGSIMAENAAGENAYSVFLGGDFPLIKIVSEVDNNRKVLIIKDSYGNAFAPYLALHFKETYIIDYRHFNSNLIEFIKKNGITDFIIAHNTFVANSPYTVVKERGLLGGYTAPKNNISKPKNNEKKNNN